MTFFGYIAAEKNIQREAGIRNSGKTSGKILIPKPTANK